MSTSPVYERQNSRARLIARLSTLVCYPVQILNGNAFLTNRDDLAGSQLADRVAALEAEKAALLLQQQAVPSPIPERGASKSSGGKNTAPEPPDTNAAESLVVARLRLDLAEALRARGQAQTRLQAAEAELALLRVKTDSDSKAIRELTADRKVLSRKLRDREEELRAKNKLVADVQDELTVLNMELGMVEKRRAEKEAENKQLVERFMKRVGQEAEAMNIANEKRAR